MFPSVALLDHADCKQIGIPHLFAFAANSAFVSLTVWYMFIIAHFNDMSTNVTKRNGAHRQAIALA